MVKAELSYNPYLLETGITFHGQRPKINSLVEKYQSGILYNWIAGLPDIFYSEMNGWDFDLDFVGTKVDFEALQMAFDAARVGRSSVRIFHKNELECAERKSEEISALIDWLKENPNRRFSLSDFWQNNSALFDDDYSFIIIQGPTNIPPIYDVAIENLSSVGELAQAVLDDTPVLFYINEQNQKEFRRNLTDILKRSDVTLPQLFFCIAPELNRAQVERVIHDLGVDNPQIVASTTDDIIVRYFEVYPKTNYVRQVIDVLRNTQSDIGTILYDENERSIQINGAVHERIDRLEEIIQKLKSAYERTAQRDNYELPPELTKVNEDFIIKIINWRKKRIRMTSDEEAVRVSGEFTREIHDYFKEYIVRAGDIFQTAVNEINSTFHSIYSSAEFGDMFMASQSVEFNISGYELPDLHTRFLELKTEEHAVPNDSPFSFLKDVFGNVQPSSSESIKVVTYLYQEWRDSASALIEPVLDDITQSLYKTLKDYHERLAQDYIEHLKTLIEQHIKIKEEAAAQLSDDERKLQEDNDWFSIFKEKLREIERS